MSSSFPVRASWVLDAGPESDVVISTRARLARNLAEYPFPTRASAEDLASIATKVEKASDLLRERFPEMTVLNLAKASPDIRDALLGAHIVSPDHAIDTENRIIVLEPTGKLSIMVNEEDHLRVQSLLPGLNVSATWGLVDWADDVLSGRLNFGYSSRYGYLTSSVSNVGTGLRISVMMHLAGLSMCGRLRSTLRAAYDLGASIRGMFGEGSKLVGDTYQVSNELTLGITESEIADRVLSTASYLVRQERDARMELLSERRQEILSRASGALHKLQNARALTVEQTLTLVSPVRLALSTGLGVDGSVTIVNEILAEARAASGQSFEQSNSRAELIRRKTVGITLVSGKNIA